MSNETQENVELFKKVIPFSYLTLTIRMATAIVRASKNWNETS